MKHWFSDVRAFRRDPLAFARQSARECDAPLVRMRLGPAPFYLVADPALVKPLLRADETVIDKGRHIAKLRPVLGDNTLTLSGPEQQRRRGALHSILARGTVEGLTGDLSTEIRAAAASVAASGQLEASAFGAMLALKLVCVAVFGRNALSAADEQAVLAAIRSLENDFADDMFRVAPLMPWEKRRRDKERVRVRAVMRQIVRSMRDRAADSSAMRSLASLGLSDDELSDEATTLLIAGHHTTGTSIAWMLYHMATEPGLMERLRAEANRVANASGELTAASLKDADVSASVVKEILRLYPGAWWFIREVKSRTELGGMQLRPGTCLMVSPWQLHRDERYWERPDAFSLGRDFSSKAFLPFGAGPRTCIGMGLAMLEMQLVALEFASAFQIAFSGAPPQPIASVSLLAPAISLKIAPALARDVSAYAA